jgi:hypothetical protein
MDSGFRLSPSKHARLIIYPSHWERLLSASWVDNMPGRLKSNEKNDKVDIARPSRAHFPPPDLAARSLPIPAAKTATRISCYSCDQGYLAVESRGQVEVAA